MCRAIRVVLAASDSDTATTLRRAVGAEAEVVDVVSDAAGAAAAGGPFDVDIAVIDARMADAVQIMRVLIEERPRIGVVWVGDGAPDGTHATVPFPEVEDGLSGAVVKALLARR